MNYKVGVGSNKSDALRALGNVAENLDLFL